MRFRREKTWFQPYNSSFPTDRSKVALLFQFFFVLRLWFHMWRLFCHYFIMKTRLYNFDPHKPHFYSEHSSRRAKRVANKVTSTVENMIKEKYHTTIYTFSRNRSDQYFLPFSSRKLSPVGRTGADLIIPLVTKFGSH